MSNIDRDLKTRCAAAIANSKDLDRRLEELDIRNDRVMLKAGDAIEHSMAAIAASVDLAGKIAMLSQSPTDEGIRRR
jgi:hypothetical protein